MSSAICPTCQELSGKAVAAISYHIRLLGKLEVAQLQRNEEVVAELEPEVAAALDERQRRSATIATTASRTARRRSGAPRGKSRRRGGLVAN